MMMNAELGWETCVEYPNAFLFVPLITYIHSSQPLPLLITKVSPSPQFHHPFVFSKCTQSTHDHSHHKPCLPTRHQRTPTGHHLVWSYIGTRLNGRTPSPTLPLPHPPDPPLLRPHNSQHPHPCTLSKFHPQEIDQKVAP